jgi:hypothetical protein
MTLPTAQELSRAMALIVQDGHEAANFRDLARLARRDITLLANAAHFTGLIADMKQVSPALADSVVHGAMVRGLYLGLRIAELREQDAAALVEQNAAAGGGPQ